MADKHAEEVTVNHTTGDEGASARKNKKTTGSSRRTKARSQSGPPSAARKDNTEKKGEAAQQDAGTSGKKDTAASGKNKAKNGSKKNGKTQALGAKKKSKKNTHKAQDLRGENSVKGTSKNKKTRGKKAVPEGSEHVISTRGRHQIKRALVSVYDKTGLEEFAQALHEAGVEIVSTGSTAARIEQAGIPVTPVDDVTGFPECLDGRVKTLHPHIHAGILADRRKKDHVRQLNEQDIRAFDLVVCNLYPFENTVASGAKFEECVEQIDIGGPSMVRAAAKNHACVAVIVSPKNYNDALGHIAKGGYTYRQRRRLAAEAFTHTAHYDAAVSQWFIDQVETVHQRGKKHDSSYSSPDDNNAVNKDNRTSALVFEDVIAALATENEQLPQLRYGENPHQQAAAFAYPLTTGGIAHAKVLHGKPMSFNNYYDADAAVRAAYDHDEPCVAVCKHANPCGVAVANDIAKAHQLAHDCDPVSAFGGVIAANREVTQQMAEQIRPIFTEVVVAPSFSEDALEILKKKKNLRLLTMQEPEKGELEFRPISGGMMVQAKDDVREEGDDPAHWKLVAGKAVADDVLADLAFAWRAVRSVRSNAVLLAKNGATVGIGMGQVNRVDSVKLAVERANTLGSRSTGDAASDAGGDHSEKGGVGGARTQDITSDVPEERARGSVAASDAFFPFADGPQVLIDAGVIAIVEPGGSVRDDEVIEACDKAGVALYFTGVRHFSHAG